MSAESLARKETKGAREEAKTGGGEGYLHRNASPGSPRYARESARARARALTHARTHRVYMTRKTPKEGNREFPLMPQVPST